MDGGGCCRWKGILFVRLDTGKGDVGVPDLNEDDPNCPDTYTPDLFDSRLSSSICDGEVSPPVDSSISRVAQ